MCILSWNLLPSLFHCNDEITRKSSCGKSQEVYCPRHNLSLGRGGGYPLMGGMGFPSLSGRIGYPQSGRMGYPHLELGPSGATPPPCGQTHRQTCVKALPSLVLRTRAVITKWTYLRDDLAILSRKMSPSVSVIVMIASEDADADDWWWDEVPTFEDTERGNEVP